jgi:cytochrome c-type biogenesis protein CcmH
MLIFWGTALLLCLIAAGFVLLPLLFAHRREDADDRSGVNIGIFGERQRELASALDSGEIDADSFDVLDVELKRNLLQDTADAMASTAPESSARHGARGSRWLPVALAVLVPVFALIAYSDLGFSWGRMNDVLLAGDLQQVAGAPHGASDMETAVARLAERLKQQPDNDEAWFLLAQSYMNLERYDESIKAFQHLVDRYPKDGDLRSYLAEVMFLAAGRVITPEVDAAIDSTLALNPQNVTILEIRGMDAFSRGALGESVSYFQRALASGAEGERAQVLNQTIDGIKSMMRQQGLALPVDAAAPATAVAAATTTTTATTTEEGTGRSIAVAVSLANDLPMPANAAVFVYARAMAGPPMPLAVRRLGLNELPLTLVLDESMAMAPGMGLANFDTVEVVARVSSSGMANAKPDDFEGEVRPRRPHRIAADGHPAH